ncbi:DUF2313 domain-containing protein [Xylanibacillus composti]|uniref:Phage portal protein n=1 Tax=Xylanibacillus composti TaxID=1572762 RepID=A0A8J4M463_9BACL|nr:putative phage tail protein [Xylanibacillus composti]MDT9723756.1 DUF2313 domain-containing protein [Xylanibacillus composti]GIQ70775.1 phage portal protein [Xylanibacillus composti]
MAERIMQHLPDYYRVIEDFKELDHTETIELDLLQGAVNQLFNDQFVMTSNLQAIRRREQMLGIQADANTEPLEFRKRRILNRYQTKPPFTVRYLQQQLDRLVGPGMTIVSVDVQNFVLYVTTNIETASVFREVQRTIGTVKPANMVYQQNTSIEEKIGVEEKISRREITWNYKLGSWKLGQKPFASLGPEVPVE